MDVHGGLPWRHTTPDFSSRLGAPRRGDPVTSDGFRGRPGPQPITRTARAAGQASGGGPRATGSRWALLPGEAPDCAPPGDYWECSGRWRGLEFAFWLAAPLPLLLAPSHLQLASQIAITALFALSLDLILGYAGIVSLGHAAFFGLGAYAAGLLAKAGWGAPLTGLVLASSVAGLV